MAKKSWILIVGIILIAIALFGGSFGLFSTISPGSYEVATSCETAAANFLEGATQEGQCFVYTLNGVKSLRYIDSLIETTGTCSISPSCPDGIRYHCSIDSSTSWASIFLCSTAWDNGAQVKVCKYDSDCTSNNCVNAMCQEGLPRDCTSLGATRCYSSTQFQSCLTSGKWSGITYCETGKTCYGDRCMTPQEIIDANTDGEGPGTDGNNGFEFGNNTETYILVGGGLLILLAALGIFRN